jgi:hypothetical protein
VQTLHRKDRDDLSCGCWKRERTATIVTETRWKDSHGLSKHPFYALWSRIKKRCYNPNAHNYRWYGARGIRMADEWVNDAGAFIAYVEANLGPRPSPKHSINRIDNDGDYRQGNIEWADPLQQAHSRGGKFAH